MLVNSINVTYYVCHLVYNVLSCQKNQHRNQSYQVHSDRRVLICPE